MGSNLLYIIYYTSGIFMKFSSPKPNLPLEKTFLDQVEKDTPSKIKAKNLVDLNTEGEFSFTLKREYLEKFDPNGEALGIMSWFENYAAEAKVSTAGIRGIQNPLYPWDTRYPLNLVGVMLATMGKILVSQETPGEKTKIAACEVRYNSSQYVELISRIQAAYGITTWITDEYQTIPIFLISFLVFVFDLYGGEYATSSHSMCKKIATKDLNTQGSQYIPSESLLFVEKVRKILEEVRTKGEYTIKISSKDDRNLEKKFLASIDNGIKLYVDYLKQGVATQTNLNYIRGSKNKILVDCMGGSMYKTLSSMLTYLGMLDQFDFLHATEDSFNHGIGKVVDENGKFFDWGCDTTIMKINFDTMHIGVPVLESANYESLLKDYPLGTTLLITDPDADRLVMAYIEKADELPKIKQRGLVHLTLDKERILVMFTPNQSFLMTVDFQQKALLKAGIWDKYNWFILKTTASQRSWDEWAKANNVPTINTPVGFKELADAMINIERKLKETPGEEIIIKDVLGNSINVGKKPRLLFAGEESGGEIFGPPELVSSNKGRLAISMREKSAGEAVVITAAMASWLAKNNMSPADYLWNIYERNNIVSRYEIRIDCKYYNESEADITKLLKEKEAGMRIKEENDAYFLSLALGYRDGIITLDQVKDILTECFSGLDFSTVVDIKFVGDGTYILCTDKCLEVRPSGTDAMNKAYGYGIDQWDCIKFAQKFTAYSGTRNPLHKKYIPEEFYNEVKDYSFEIYSYYKEHQ